MNTRMQVTISEQDHALVSAKARASGISIAEYLRRLVRRDLEGGQPRTRADVGELFGIGDSGGSDVGSHKQDYLADSIAEHKADVARRP